MCRQLPHFIVILKSDLIVYSAGSLKSDLIVDSTGSVDIIIMGNVLRRNLRPGDHIYSWRRKALCIYAHHGIYVGNNNVIHFTKISTRQKNCGCGQRNTGVICTCLDCFLEGDCLYRYKYGVSKLSLLLRGSCTVAVSDPPKKVIHRAEYLLQNGFGKYDLCRKNCEDFALYCKTGFVPERGCGASGQVAAIGACFLQRYKADIGVRVDKIEVPVEQILEWFEVSDADETSKCIKLQESS